MKAQQFIEWRRRRCLKSVAQTAEFLGVSVRTIYRYQGGKHLIPRWVAVVCDRLKVGQETSQVGQETTRDDSKC